MYLCRIGGTLNKRTLKYHPDTLRFLTPKNNTNIYLLELGGQCVVGSFAGAADSERVTELYKGRLKRVGYSL